MKKGGKITLGLMSIAIIFMTISSATGAIVTQTNTAVDEQQANLKDGDQTETNTKHTDYRPFGYINAHFPSNIAGNYDLGWPGIIFKTDVFVNGRVGDLKINGVQIVDSGTTVKLEIDLMVFGLFLAIPICFIPYKETLNIRGLAFGITVTY